MKNLQLKCLSLIIFSAFSFFPVDGQGSWKLISSKRGEIPVPNNGKEQTCAVVCDINKDGMDNFVIGERTSTPSVVWYSYNGKTFDRHIIDNTQLTPEAGGDYYDLDGDGDLDIVLSADSKGNQIWWWENPFPDFNNPWKRRLIKNSGANQHHDITFGDYTGDGKVELLAWNQRGNQMLMFKIPKNPKKHESEWKSTIIYDYSGDFKLEGFAMPPVDVDQDGKIDIVGGGRWFKHKGGTTFEPNILDNRRFAQVAAGQLVKGGYSEILVSPGDASGMIIWYEWKNGKWEANPLHHIIHGHTAEIKDVNKDGNLDVFIGEMGKPGNGANARVFIWYGDGKGNFNETIAYHGQGIHAGKLGDFNGDGYLDILVKPYNHNSPCIEVLINRGTEKLTLDKWERIHIADLSNYTVYVKSADLDGDSWPDIVAGGTWWKNPGKTNGKWIQKTIGDPLNNMATLYDFNNDGFIDILGTKGIGANANNEFVLALNDGKGSFILHEVGKAGNRGDFLQGVEANNFGDTHKVILSWHNGGEGTGTFEVPKKEVNNTWDHKIITDFTLKEDISLGDIDRDGDYDILLGHYWLQNNDGEWIRHKMGDIPEGESDRNDLADINGNGRLDVVVGMELSEDLWWYEAPEDPTKPWTMHKIDRVAGQGFSMDVADFNNDGYPDIILGEHRGKEVNRVIIYENQEKGKNWKQHVIDSGPTKEIDHHDGTQAVDIDNDGDLDIISIGWYNKKIWLYENKAIQ